MLSAQREEWGQGCRWSSLFICVFLIIVSLIFHLDLTVGWKSPQYQEWPSFVQKDDTLDKRKPIDALLQINGSVQSILQSLTCSHRYLGNLLSLALLCTGIHKFQGLFAMIFISTPNLGFMVQWGTSSAGCSGRAGLLVLNSHSPPHDSSKTSSKREEMTQSSFLHHHYNSFWSCYVFLTFTLQ